MTTATTTRRPGAAPKSGARTARKPRQNRSSAPRAPAMGDSNAEQVRSWLTLSRTQLDDIYSRATPGEIPQGETRGTPIFAGWPAPRLLSALAHRLAWQGKVFDLPGPARDAGTVVNRVSPLGVNAIVAKVYPGPSWLDGNPTTIIDYSSTSLVARGIRDEIRQVAPGLYLGKVWLGHQRILDFALELPVPAAN